MTFERSIEFTIPGTKGAPGVKVRIVEADGKLVFTVDVQDNLAAIADLRGLFFDLNDTSKLAGLTFTGGGGQIVEMQGKAGAITDLGNGANMSGARKGGFDVGLEFGSSGIGARKADLSGPISFTLDNTAHNLTLDDVANTLFGARLTSVGAPNGARSDSAKLTFVAPAAPDAKADAYTIFEDGQVDAATPSQAPVGQVFQVLRNDTDADGNILTITKVDGAQHGTVLIIDGDDADTLVGDAILYTPDADYAGSDSFTYAITDNAGGTDFAKVDVTVTAVADVPTLSYTIQPGSTVNQVRLFVTSKQTDADSSEFIDRIELSGIPAGVIVTQSSVNPGEEPDELVHEFVLTLPINTDIDFNLGVTSVSKETTNGDEQTAFVSVPIVVEHELTNQATTFQAVDQSIWNTGGQFTFTDDRFLGIDTSWDKSGGSFIYGATSGHLKAGFQSTLVFEGGEIDASAPYNLSFETNYNKATDVLFLTADATLGNVTFMTEGPEGSYNLNFIFDFLMKYKAGLDFGELGTWEFFDSKLGPITANESIIDIDSEDLSYEFELPAGFSLEIAWPTVNTASSGSTSSGATSQGASNNFLELGLDVDDLVFSILKLPNPFNIPIDIAVAEGSAELIDLDLSAGLNFLQSFALEIGSLTGEIIFEDGFKQAFNFNDSITLNDASSHDKNNDGDIGYQIMLKPAATLNNNTDLGINFGYQFDALKASGSYDVGFKSGAIDLGPIFTAKDTFDLASVDLYNTTFGVNFGSQNYSLFA
ncbi:MAG TPA: cadherin-like domain-containing protein [Microvirga sp.]|jgi:hypothetical protein